MKKIISLILCVALCFALGTAVFAEPTTTPSTTPSTTPGTTPGTTPSTTPDTTPDEKGFPDYSKTTSFKLLWSHTQDGKANPYISLRARSSLESVVTSKYPP